MKTITQSHPVQITKSVTAFNKINNHLIRPLKAGFKGFTVVIMLLFFFNLLTYLGSSETFGMDLMDLTLAGFGFVLQSTSTLLKNFAR